VTYLPPDPAVDPTPPRVAFAIGKSAGGAVVRNRIRRRLRAGLRELAAQGHLPAGTYLLGASPALADRPWPELVADLEAAVDVVTDQATA
jgi:ribonuclease P protein component